MPSPMNLPAICRWVRVVSCSPPAITEPSSSECSSSYPPPWLESSSSAASSSSERNWERERGQEMHGSDERGGEEVAQDGKLVDNT